MKGDPFSLVGGGAERGVDSFSSCVWCGAALFFSGELVPDFALCWGGAATIFFLDSEEWSKTKSVSLLPRVGTSS